MLAYVYCIVMVFSPFFNFDFSVLAERLAGKSISK